jgi:hypothetical protein
MSGCGFSALRFKAMFRALIGRFLTLSLSIAAIVVVVNAQHESRAYLPLTAKELGLPFPLKRVGLLTGTSSPLTSTAGVSGSEYEVRNGKDAAVLFLKGGDRAGDSWLVSLVELYACAGGVPVYESDVDADGVKDALLLARTCGNGLAPSVHLLIVTFDPAGRPSLFEVEGYFAQERGGIDSLVDLNRDGKAELLFMNFSDGYWITSIYSIQNARWSRVQGLFSGRVFPLYTRFTTRPNTRAVTPAANRHPWAPDLSNAKPLIEGTLMNWQWPTGAANLDVSELDLKLTIVTNGNKILCTPAYWYDSAKILIDEATGRTIERLTESNRGFVDPWLKKIVSDRLPVRLYGRRYPDRCSPELMWVQS